jgi:hypothetical protein
MACCYSSLLGLLIEEQFVEIQTGVCKKCGAPLLKVWTFPGNKWRVFGINGEPHKGEGPPHAVRFRRT